MADEKKEECGQTTEIYSRVVGYFRPVQSWNTGKKEEFKDRKEYALNSDPGKDCGC